MSSLPVTMLEIAKEWLKDPEFRAEYKALEPEFALASALIEARSRAGMTQVQVAEAMGTTQAVIARLEGGRVKPSTRTSNARNFWADQRLFRASHRWRSSF
jgi:DNA-binding XRE family transcriptional regulator